MIAAKLAAIGRMVDAIWGNRGGSMDVACNRWEMDRAEAECLDDFDALAVLIGASTPSVAAPSGWQPKLTKVRETFDALLVAEVKAFGGVPSFAGRAGEEQNAFRQAVAELLAEAPPVASQAPNVVPDRDVDS